MSSRREFKSRFGRTLVIEFESSSIGIRLCLDRRFTRQTNGRGGGDGSRGRYMRCSDVVDLIMRTFNEAGDGEQTSRWQRFLCRSLHESIERISSVRSSDDLFLHLDQFLTKRRSTDEDDVLS